MTPRTRILAAALGLLASLVPSPLAGTAQAAWPGRNGAILFQAFRSGGEEAVGSGVGIWSSPPGAPYSQIERLATAPGDVEPQVSPDGRHVVFVREVVVPGVSFSAAIYTMAVGGSGLTQVTNGLHEDLEPAFSASGKRIYFTRIEKGSEDADIYSVRLDGGGLRSILSGPADDRDPAVSPNGRLIAFERSPAGAAPHFHHLFTARTDGTRPRDLTPGLLANDQAIDPDFSPAGDRIAFVRNGDLVAVRPDGGNRRRLLAQSAASNRAYGDPAYSPDGRSLLFVESSISGSADLRCLNLRSHRLSRTPPVRSGAEVASASWQPR